MSELKKVMIIEKQKAMINFYKDRIDWLDKGFEVINVTANVIQALAFFAEYKHDLVICDTNLLGGRAFKLIKQFKELNQNSYILISSDDDSYNSVRDAFKNGADDYLIRMKIKPVNINQILISINELEITNKQKYPEQNKVKNVLGNIVDKQQFNKESSNIILNIDQMDVSRKQHRLLIIRMDNVFFINRGFSDLESENKYSLINPIFTVDYRDVLKNSIDTTLKNYINKFEGIVNLFVKDHSCILLIPETQTNNFIKDINTLQYSLNTETGKLFSLFMSDICSFDFTTSLLHIYEYVDYKFYQGDNCIILNKNNYEFNFEQITFNEDIYNDFMTKNFQDTISSLNVIINKITINNYDPNHVKNYFVNVLNRIKNNISKENIIDDELFNTCEKSIEKSETIFILKKVLIEILRVLHDKYKNVCLLKNEKYTKIMTEYIHQNINKKITISDLSNLIGVTCVHASRVFKNETGVPLSKYINNYKMEMAIKLLIVDNIKIKEISDKLGFDNQLYFSKVFKSFYGISPITYRKKHNHV